MISFEARQLDRDSPVPLWFQIAELLRQAIETGEIGPGERLENEVEMSEHLGVSRPTVRQAIQALAHKELLVRRRGVGTIVAARRIKRPVALTSLHDDLLASGREPSTEVLSVAECAAQPEVAGELGIEPGDPVIALERLRSAEGSPLALMSNFVPLAILHKTLVAEDLESHGLYEVLRDQGIRFHAAHQVIGARSATPVEARLLKAGRGATVLTMARTASDVAGVTIEFGQHCYLASRYSFEMSLSLR